MKQATAKPKTKFVRRMGHWVEKPRRMEILTCSCGNKYIKTRVDQEVCVKCLARNQSI